MTRQTSLEAYKYILESGILKKQKLEIYEVLWGFQRMGASLTAGELQKRYFPKTSRNNIATRISELIKCGIVKECGERDCGVSGRMCHTYTVTNEKPVKAKKKKSLKTENDRLRKALKPFVDYFAKNIELPETITSPDWWNERVISHGVYSGEFAYEMKITRKQVKAATEALKEAI